MFGWAMVARKSTGETVVDHQGHWIDEADLAEAAFDLVKNVDGPMSGEQHDPEYAADGRLIFSAVFTDDLCKAMGMDPAAVDHGHFIGVEIEDRDAYLRVKSGERPMLSIEGTALLVDEDPSGAIASAV